jgi:hypothetical protein
VRAWPGSYRDDDVEVVELDVAGDLTARLVLNYPGFPDSCRRLKFALGEHIPDVLVDRWQALLEQVRHLALAEPDGLVLESHLDSCLAVEGRVEEELRAAEAAGLTRGQGSRAPLTGRHW